MDFFFSKLKYIEDCITGDISLYLCIVNIIDYKSLYHNPWIYKMII